MVGRWLHDGMPVLNQADQQKKTAYGTLDEEFFIEDNELLILDPDFWTEGYVLRDDATEQLHGSNSVPMFLVHVAVSVLGAGKSIGLLRALGIPMTLSDELASGWAHQWPSFATLAEDTSRDGRPHTFSVEDLSRVVYDGLQPYCQAAQSQLTKVIVEDCDLWEHLTVIEDVYLMRRGDVMSRLADAIFAKMDSGQTWSDFHFLNSAFRDITAGTHISADASLIRLSYRGGRDKAASRSVRAFEGLSVEYAAPFPLTYVFGPRTTQIYSSIFVFLLQVRRAKSVLERILVRGAAKGAHTGNDLKILYAMRSRLSWFVNVLLDFIATYVIHEELTKFHDALKGAKSLDEVIQLHQDHLDKLEKRCFLHPNSASIRRAIHSVLDIALHFNDCFVAFAGDTTLDISRQSLMSMKKHRSRRLQRQRKDAIGFSQSLQEAAVLSSDSSSDSEDDDENTINERSYSLAASMSAPEDGVGRIDKMSAELDGLVRLVRRSVESLAGGTGDAAPTFGIFAFALEDWDK
ncbi:hypothetical protein DENSPDRAFT_925940 [Dentipellis sp. KUC8613]|nr:hypothetical protein DENSPDRAFT_925940 [Dentipellis sp. KUC8613]